MQYIDNGLVLKDNVKYAGINLHLLLTSWECIVLNHKRCIYAYDASILTYYNNERKDLYCRIAMPNICSGTNYRLTLHQWKIFQPICPLHIRFVNTHSVSH